MKWNVKTISIASAVIVALAAAGFVVARSGPVLGQSFTIGYVDMARAVDAHPRKASAESALKDYAQSQIADAQQRMKTMAQPQREGVSIVLSREVVLYGGVDLTDLVIKEIGGK